MEKKEARIRRTRRTRALIRQRGLPCLSVHRTPQHIYAQVLDMRQGRVLACVSSLQAEVRSAGPTGNQKAARLVGRLIADKSLAAGIERVAFDRSGFKYHGRIQALAEAAREAGLVF